MRWAIVLTCCALPSGIVQAQNAPAAFPDTSIWRPIIEYAIKSLAPYAARVATDTTSRAWRFQFPQTGAPWSLIGSHFRTMLRARPPVPGDTVHVFEIGDLVVSGDTVRLVITTDVSYRCATGTGGYGNADNVFVYSVVTGPYRYWSSARSTGIRHGDRFGCR
ncbi:MAG: hypothetical protein WEE89_22665 [Gemmatimonadota bacterium]